MLQAASFFAVMGKEFMHSVLHYVDYRYEELVLRFIVGRLKQRRGAVESSGRLCGASGELHALNGIKKRVPKKR